MNRLKRSLMIFSIFSLATCILPQFSQRVSAAQKPSFEVTSVKPTTIPGPVNTSPGGRYVAVGQSLKALIGYAYRLRGYQVLGGPAWAGTDLWEIQAKAREGSVPPRSTTADLTKPDTIALMLQSLLEERFRLKAHHKVREFPIYELVITKRGPKITLSADQTPITPGSRSGPPPRLPNGLPELTRGGYVIRGGPGGLRKFGAKAVPVSTLINVLTNVTNRTVIDKTDLTGLYDMELEWTADDLQVASDAPKAPASNAPVLTTAIEEQLGLKLQSSKGPVEVLVIDSVEKPSEN